MTIYVALNNSVPVHWSMVEPFAGCPEVERGQET